jgi:hypothetical protein
MSSSRQDARGVEVVGVAQLEDHDLEPRVLADTAHLVAEQFGRSKEQFAFDVDDGDGLPPLGRRLQGVSSPDALAPYSTSWGRRPCAGRA